MEVDGEGRPLNLRLESLRAVEGGLDGGAVLRDLAVLRFQQGRLDEARPLFERSLLVDSRHVNTLYNLGNLHYLQDRFDEARRLWERVLAVDPRHVPTLSSLGILHFEQGRPDEARQFWEQALKINPEDQSIQSALAGLTPPQLSTPEPPPPQPVRLPARTEVVIRGLSTRPELNGRRGVVRSFNTERGR